MTKPSDDLRERFLRMLKDDSIDPVPTVEEFATALCEAAVEELVALAQPSEPIPITDDEAQQRLESEHCLCCGQSLRAPTTCWTGLRRR